MDEPNDIQKLLDPTKPERKWNMFLPCDMLPNRCLACKLQDDGIIQGAKISDDAAVIATKTLIDELLSFQEVQFRRAEEFDDGIKARDNRCNTCADQVLAV